MRTAGHPRSIGLDREQPAFPSQGVQEFQALAVSFIRIGGQVATHKLNSHLRSLHSSASAQEISECDSAGNLELGALVAIYGIDALFERLERIIDTFPRELRLFGLRNVLACCGCEPVVSFSGHIALHFKNG